MCVCIQVNKDVMVLHYVSKILKEVVPLMEHPSQSFLASLEEDLVKLIMKHGQLVCRLKYGKVWDGREWISWRICE